MLQMVRDAIAGNEVDAQFAHVPFPAGATSDTERWSYNTHTGQWDRSVEWADFPLAIPTVSVCVDGIQATDGTFNRDVALYAERCARLNAAEARQVAAALLQAADELDRLG